MTAYWIAHVTVTDEEVYGRYAKLAARAVAEHGGHFLARGGRHVTKEGEDHARNVVAEFPTYEDAVNCYESATYQEALVFAKQSSIRHLSIVEGA